MWTGTAEELHELVKDVPELLDGLTYEPVRRLAGWTTMPGWYDWDAPVNTDEYGTSHPNCTPQRAARLIFAGVVERLVKGVWTVGQQPVYMSEGKMDTLTGGWRVDFGVVGSEVEGPTALHAAVEAWKKVRK